MLHKFPEQQKIVVKLKDESLTTIKVEPIDQFYLNEETSKFDELAEGDLLDIKGQKDEAGQPFRVVRASRPQTHQGTIFKIDASKRSLIVSTTSPRGSPLELTVFVPEKLA